MQKWLEDSVESFNTEYAKATTQSTPEGEPSSSTPANLDLATPFRGVSSLLSSIEAPKFDLGEKLGCLGHVRELRRIWSGPFDAAIRQP